MVALSKYVSLAVPIGTGACLAYLFGYWGPLGINVLEHIGLSDVVRLSLYPMAISLSSIVLGMILGALIGPLFPPGGGQKTEIGKAVKKGEWIFWTLHSGLFVWGFFWGKEPYKWVGLAMMLGVLAVPVSNSKVMITLLPEYWVRYTTASVVLLIPSLAFAFGRVNAFSVLDGSADRVIDVSRVDAELNLRATPQRPIMYAGKIGDRFALYETLSKQIVLVSDSRLPILPIREK
jgi:hypothetical protein